MPPPVQHVYNTSPLAHSDVEYIGREVPTASLNYPGIILQPLTTLYQRSRADKWKAHQHASVYIYSSGILFREARKFTWFPIQNLYCSAAYVPTESKGRVSFEDLSSWKKKSKRPKKLIFAVVVRQPTEAENGLSRRVLMCYAFVLSSETTAQGMVEATKHAYQNRAGWNHPMNDMQFLNAKIDYTEDRINNNDEEGIQKLKDITQDRDLKLSRQRPVAEQRARPSPTPSRTPTTPSAQSRRPSTSVPVQQRAVILSPRPGLLDARGSSLKVVSAATVAGQVRKGSGRVSTAQAAGYYQGFNSDVSTNGLGTPIRARSVAGSSAGIFTTPPQFMEDFSGMGIRLHSRRQMSAPTTPKKHRVLASSEPTEHLNGRQQTPSVNGSVSVVDWDEVLEPPTQNGGFGIQNGKRFSKKSHTQQMNGRISSAEFFIHRVQRNTPAGAASEPDYNITKVSDVSGSSGAVGGEDTPVHAPADQKL